MLLSYWRAASGSGNTEQIISSDPRIAAAASRSARGIRALLAISFIGSLGFSIVLPFLVFLVERLGGNALVYGGLGATYSAFQLVGAPALGRWSDRVGRRRVLLVSQVGTLAAWVLFLVAVIVPVFRIVDIESDVLGSFALTVPLLLLFAARALDGITGGNVSVANAYMADLSKDSEQSVNFGRMSAASNLGFVAGPILGGLLGSTELGELPVVLAAVVVSLAGTALVAIGLPEAEPCEPVVDPDPERVHRIIGQEQRDCFTASLRDQTDGVWGIGPVRRFLGLHFLVYFAFNLFYVAFPIRTATELGWTPGGLGVFFAALGLLLAAVQAGTLARLLNRIPASARVRAGSAILAGGFIAFVSVGLGGVALALVLVALGNGLMWPSLVALLSEAAGRQRQGAAHGLAGSFAAAASIVGLLLGGALYQLLGAGVFVLGGTVTMLVVLAPLRVTARQQ